MTAVVAGLFEDAYVRYKINNYYQVFKNLILMKSQSWSNLVIFLFLDGRGYTPLELRARGLLFEISQYLYIFSLIGFFDVIWLLRHV